MWNNGGWKYFDSYQEKPVANQKSVVSFEYGHGSKTMQSVEEASGSSISKETSVPSTSGSSSSVDNIDNIIYQGNNSSFQAKTDHDSANHLSSSGGISVNSSLGSIVEESAKISVPKFLKPSNVSEIPALRPIYSSSLSLETVVANPQDIKISAWANNTSEQSVEESVGENKTGQD